jgi:repressor LexA
MMKELSGKQQRILDFIRTFIDDHDYPPSIRQIQEACDISSTSVVDYNLRALEKSGHIRRDREVSRAIEILHATGKRSRVIAVPIIGTIAAGQPIPVPAADTWQGYDQSDTIDVTPEMVGNHENVYALRVKGDSMIDALVNDGDIVLLQSASSAQNGEMVAAWLKSEQEATLKKFYQEGDRVRLQPANQTMAPIVTETSNVEVQGKVIYTFRDLS